MPESINNGYERVRDITIKTECPHCHESIVLKGSVHLDAKPVEPPEPKETLQPKAPKRGFTLKQEAFLKRAGDMGILKAFEEAALNTGAPIHGTIEKYFLVVVRTMRPRMVPGNLVDELREQYPEGYIGAQVSNGIACITVDGVIRQFIPQSMLCGRTIVPLGSGNKGGTTPRLDINVAEVREWVRTRRGYIPVDCAQFFEALATVTSIGAYDNLSMSSATE